jgi:glutamyl-tRNA reductase
MPAEALCTIETTRPTLAGPAAAPAHRPGTVGVLGITYRSDAFHRLGALRLGEERRAACLDAVQRLLGLDELLYLATCNRIELLYSAAAPIRRADDPRLGALLSLLGASPALASELHLHTGEAAARHLFRVASALDSMVVGEAQILGQFKRAYGLSREEGRIGTALGPLCEEALRVAREVRRGTGLSSRKLSLLSLVSEEIHAHLDDVSEPAVALVGAGEMIAKVAEQLAELEPARLLFVNRTLEHAEALAALHGGEAMALHRFLAEPVALDLLVTATTAPVTLIDPGRCARMVPGRGPGLLLVDLAVPGDVDRACAALPRVELVGIEDLRRRAEKNRAARLAEIELAEPMVERALERYELSNRERLLAELACSVHGALARLLAAAPCPIAGWDERLLHRAHRISMALVRDRVTGCPCASEDELATLVTELEAAPPKGTPDLRLCRSLSDPAALDKKALRLLAPVERLALQSWLAEKAPGLAALVAGTIERLEAPCACAR